MAAESGIGEHHVQTSQRSQRHRGHRFGPAVKHATAHAQATKIHLRGVYASPGITYGPLFLANHMGLWAKNGLEVELKSLQGGPLSVVALTNREADFAGVASTDPVLGAIKNIRQLSIMTCTGVLAVQYAATKNWLARIGVSPKSPLQDKLKAFKGARVGSRDDCRRTVAIHALSCPTCGNGS